MKMKFVSQLSARIIFLLLLVHPNTEVKAQEKETIIHKGDVITHTIKVKKGTYYFEDLDSLTPALIIEGNNITIDFNGAILKGNKNIKQPNLFSGAAIIIKKGNNIILKNAIINGFKVGIMASNVDGLEITNCDLSYNFRQHLNSDRFKEDVSDWQSYHHNDNDEWLRFGAGIYLKNCDNALVHDNIITNGQCGLMMTHCDNGKVYNNNFSFNSGVGLGMNHSNKNYVLNNKIAWNVRGYSYGYYYRGQDSGGILVFDQSSDNVFANNSVTHSGDGFFLWAGQQTIDDGSGGCNDNLIYDNDFSYAPTNAVEITFSRNKIIKNKLHGSWHGVWGGFSYNTVIVKNDFRGNLAGISIEHGQDNIIERNSFTSDSLAIELWAIPNRKADFGLMKYKDTRSRDYSIMANTFTNVPIVYSIKNTQSVTIANNVSSGYRTLQKFDTLVKDVQYKSNASLYDYTRDSLFVSSLLPGITRQDALLLANHPQGKKAIMMTEWGPYNFSYPLLWWTKTDSSGKLHFEILGPEGKWKIKTIQGAKPVTASAGNMPGILEVQKDPNSREWVNIKMEYSGEKIVSPFGEIIPAGHNYIFGYKENSLPMNWNISWFKFDSTTDPVKKSTAFNTLLNSTSPLKTVQASSLDYDKVKGQSKEVPHSSFATLVNTDVNAPKGTYRIGVTAGDIVKVYVDDKLVIDSWDPSAIVFDADYHKDAIVKLNGKHHIKIVQAQYGDYGMLSCTIKRIDQP